ncbi:hypothetical protein [Streptomyces resistomycificus]|uniref:Lipoprotein n=1 Tax=Streptomyces resistomycificus TaxID=67356 RepID=A0A0L8KW98_9ACTN|nr:hypothetical protein [Streptomyces resistomycificus]KOG30211.1 hypothetical protein ADK37_34965 [Streptomyces resistomycificus]KUN97013.1 hypothetical protein AQJ84_17300 [Streptomyces resistomycificus]
MNLRLLALAGVVACAVALPLAMASAGQVGDEGNPLARDAVRPAPHPRASAPADARDAVRPSAPADAKAPSAEPADSPLLLGLGLATAARCGPELTSPDGVEAQTCVLTQGEESWARTYYRNATGGALDSVLSLMGPGGRTVQIHCAVGADDEPGTCETPREATRGNLEGYTAVAEFAARGGTGPLLLRSGSNSEAATGS